MNYYLAEAARLGIKGTKVRDIVEAAVEQPSHPRLRLAATCLAVIRWTGVPSPEVVEESLQYEAILEVEREELWRQGVVL